MAVSFATFERLKDKGLVAYRDGDSAAARPYLIQAAECMIELAESAKTSDLRTQHEAYAAELIDLAKECSDARRNGHGQWARACERDDNQTDARDWMVHDKPTIGFDDIAGLDDVKQELRLKMIYPFEQP